MRNDEHESGANPAPPDAKDDETARQRALLESPSYRRADLDPDWIATPEMRGTRLLLEYAKPQVSFARLGIHSTIVLFGGTRIVEPAEAKRRLAEARQAAAAAPDDDVLARKVRVAERIAAKSHYYDVAREFACMVSETYQRPEHRDFVVVTGGGPGIMEAGNRGAYEADGDSIGLNITLPREQVPNSYITPELCFQFRYFALRKMHFLAAAKALVAFPGGYGTFDELFETLCLIQTKVIEPVPVVLVGEQFWRKAFDVQFLVEEGVIDAEDAELFSYAETAEQIRDQLINWYEKRGLEPTNDRSPYRSW